jgi:hypothetical protein
MTDVPPPEEPAADPRDALIAAQAERIVALDALVTGLRERLAAAERVGVRNTGNSLMPPSADNLRQEARGPERCTDLRQRRPARSESPNGIRSLNDLPG